MTALFRSCKEFSQLLFVIKFINPAEGLKEIGEPHKYFFVTRFNSVLLSLLDSCLFLRDRVKLTMDEDAIPQVVIRVIINAFAVIFIISELSFVPSAVGVLHRADSTHFILFPMTDIDGTRSKRVTTFPMHHVIFPFAVIFFTS